MKYARLFSMTLMSLIIISASDNVRAQSVSRVYRYSHCDCAGVLPDLIRVGAKEVPIRFDEHSDEQALKSFRSIKYSVWLGIASRLYVTGTYNAAESTFRLEHWYTVVPFTEYLVKDEESIPHEVYKVRRKALRRSDFERTVGFDPYSPKFNPAFYQRRGRRVRAKRAASYKDLQRAATHVES
jgi:hypothetical protein